MGDTPSDEDKQQPSLELPSLRLRGRRGGRRRTAEPEPVQEQVEAPADAEPTREVVLEPEPVPEPAREPEPVVAPSRRRAPRPALTMPTVPGRVAAALTGLVVGAFAVGASFLAMEGCEAVRGTSTCGEGPGSLIMLAIVVSMVLLGTALLRALKVDDAGSASFLAVGIVAVVVLLFLLDLAFEPVMAVVVPVLGVAAYVLAHWVTTRFDDDTGRRDYT
jgi:hypothetical protein